MISRAPLFVLAPLAHSLCLAMVFVALVQEEAAVLTRIMTRYSIASLVLIVPEISRRARHAVRVMRALQHLNHRRLFVHSELLVWARRPPAPSALRDMHVLQLVARRLPRVLLVLTRWREMESVQLPELENSHHTLRFRLTNALLVNLFDVLMR